ncbi:MAG: hypothetical protein LJE63_08130 [Desulfobacteraceae bacterium]|jgi:hypothetical protein|nr:hypothetical protein [Desulfobacteraceae bacterium]
MPNLLHAADIHLISPLQRLERYAGAPLAAARQASRWAFENIITRHLRLPENVHRFATRHPETLVREDLAVAQHVQRFAARAVTRDLSADYPRAVAGACNIGLLHTCAGGREGHAPYAPCTLGGLCTGLRRP